MICMLLVVVATLAGIITGAICANFGEVVEWVIA